MDSLTGTTTEVPFLERGWGQLLPEFINQKAVVKNYAKNGRSTRTFIEEGLWTDLLTNTHSKYFDTAEEAQAWLIGERANTPVE